MAVRQLRNPGMRLPDRDSRAHGGYLLVFEQFEPAGDEFSTQLYNLLYPLVLKR